MTITRWAPLRDFVSLRDAMDKAFEETFLPPKIFGTEDGWAMPIDLFETPEHFTLKTMLPGIPSEKIDIEATATQITIKGEHTEQSKVTEGTRVREELKYGKYERTMALPAEIDPEKVEAVYENGLLTLMLPKSEVVKPKTVKIKTGK
jgi:HSP20 family protein